MGRWATTKKGRETRYIYCNINNNHVWFFITTGKAETGNHNLQEKLEKYVILLTKVVSDFSFVCNAPLISSSIINTIMGIIRVLSLFMGRW